METLKIEVFKQISAYSLEYKQHKYEKVYFNLLRSHTYSIGGI